MKRIKIFGSAELPTLEDKINSVLKEMETSATDRNPEVLIGSQSIVIVYDHFEGNSDEINEISQ